MIIDGVGSLTPEVLRVMALTPDPRLREIMVSLVKHLHGFVKEVRLTEEELAQLEMLLNYWRKII